MMEWNQFIYSNLYLIILFTAIPWGIKKLENSAAMRFSILGGLFLAFILPFFNFSFHGSEINITQGVQVFEQINIGIQEIELTQVNWLIYFYLIGLSFNALRIAIGLIKIYSSTKSASYHAKGYYLLKDSSAAFSFGGKVYIGNQIPNSSISVILQHELNHIHHLHHIDILIIQLLKLIFWFNPFIYLIENELKTIHEFQADENILVTKQDYLNLLLQNQFDYFNSPIIHSFNSNYLKQRIMRISKKSKNKNAIYYIIPALLLGGFVIISQQVKSNHTSLKTEASAFISSDQKEATFPGGNKALIDYLIERIKYPKEAAKQGLEGTVFVELKIDKSGAISEVSIKKTSNTIFDEAALNAVKDMPNWIPAEKDGKKVGSEVVLPIRFKLPTEDK